MEGDRRLGLRQQRGDLMQHNLNSLDTDLERSHHRFAAGLVEIIQLQMARKRISIRQMAADGIIPSQYRVRFFDRIARGDIRLRDLQGILDYLEIDPIRADIAVTLMEEPADYFDDACVTAARYTQKLGRTLKEVSTAMAGDFEAISESLCANHVQRIGSEIHAHQKRVVALRNQHIATLS